MFMALRFSLAMAQTSYLTSPCQGIKALTGFLDVFRLESPSFEKIVMGNLSQIYYHLTILPVIVALPSGGTHVQ